MVAIPDANSSAETYDLVEPAVELPPATRQASNTKALPRPSKRRGRGLAVVLRLIALGLIAFNAWWYRRDTRPIADLKTINQWMSSRRYDLAEPDLREHLRRFPNDGESRLVYARLLAAKDDLAGCVRELRAVPFWFPKKGEALFREGNASLMLNRAKDAETAWNELLKDDPLHPQPPDIYHDALFEIMKLYATEDRWEDAFPVLWRAYDNAESEDRTTLLMWRIRAELERVAPSESLPRLRGYVAADPFDIEALRALGRAEQALGRLDDAEIHFRACLKIDPKNPRVWRDYAALFHERGDRQGSSDVLSKIPDDPKIAEEPEIWKFRGMAFESRNAFEQAADAYRKAIALNPNVLEYHYRLGNVEERLGHRDKAAIQRESAHALREARAELPKAYSDFAEAREVRQNGGAGPKFAATCRKMETICRTLGYSRAADAWKELADNGNSESKSP